MRVLIITSLPDPHVEMVTRHFPTNVEPIIFDPRNFPHNEEMSHMWHEGEEAAITKGGLLRDVVSVWYRKPLLLAPEELPVPESYRDLTYASYKTGITWFYSILPDVPWMSDYWNIMRSNSKIYQLQIANRFRLSTPQTLITSSPEQAELFIRELQTVVVKPLNIGFVRENETLRAAYAQKLEYTQGMNLDGLRVAPVIFQEYKKGTDIRVTVVGDKVFPCIVEKVESMENQLDWRKGFYNGDIKFLQDPDFPPELGQKCVEMVKAMGLSFGAFDFIRDSSGNYWFLEINPNGQWGFVEETTEMPISQAVAQFLLQRV